MKHAKIIVQYSKKDFYINNIGNIEYISGEGEGPNSLSMCFDFSSAPALENIIAGRMHQNKNHEADHNKIPKHRRWS